MEDNSSKKGFYYSNSVTGIIVFFALLFAFAKWGPAININSTSQVKGDPFVVSGEGKVFVTPDIAKITVGINETGAQLKLVQDNVSKKSNNLTEAIEKLGVKKEDIKTTSYNLYPEYDYQSNPNRVIGYRVSVSYEVTIRDFDKVNDTIVAATAAGGNMEGNISFEINEKTKREKVQEARKLATNDAKEKADGLANAAGINLGRIINISENENPDIIRPIAYDATSIGNAAEKALPSIEPGQTEINLRVSLTYEVR